MKKIIKCMDAITKDEEREEEDRLNKEFYKTDQELSEDEKDDHIDEALGIEPVEKLSWSITDELAYRTADRFSDMVDGKRMDLIRNIILRLDRADSKVAVAMLQAMFILDGNADYAAELDMIDLCAKYNESAYDDFIFEMFDTDEFDWFITEIGKMEAFERSCPPGFLS